MNSTSKSSRILSQINKTTTILTKMQIIMASTRSSSNRILINSRLLGREIDSNHLNKIHREDFKKGLTIIMKDYNDLLIIYFN